jgi:hypothetical protein
VINTFSSSDIPPIVLVTNWLAEMER